MTKGLLSTSRPIARVPVCSELAVLCKSTFADDVHVSPIVLIFATRYSRQLSSTDRLHKSSLPAGSQMQRSAMFRDLEGT